MASLKKVGVLILALIMCATIVTPAFAVEEINGNDWYGDQVAVDVTAGTDGYTYMALFRKYVHGYEFGGHFMGDGEGPQTFVVLDTVEYDGQTWTPNGVYDPMNANYDVTYCCDVMTMIVDGTYYKRMNLEDSEYYNDYNAARIRAIVTNSYPYVSVDEMKAELIATGVTGAADLTRNDIIAAVQTAIWAVANTNGQPIRYAKSYRVSDNLQWGYPMHDTSNESGLDVAGKRVFKSYEEVGTRIDALVDYLLAQNATYADKAQIVITDLEMMGMPVMVSEEEETYNVRLSLDLNNSGSGYEDNIVITVTAGDFFREIPVVLGQEHYEIDVTAKAGEEIKAVVSGTQVLPAGVYFYAPKAVDMDGDGVATGREVSQNLVGVAMGETPVYAEDSITFGQEMKFKPGSASNISYMMIDKATGEVEFIEKIDLQDGDCSVPMILKDGYVSAMFIKQSTSGMFWFSEEVSQNVIDSTIACLMANNPSYKGHNAVCFGAGDHTLEFKAGKFATYTFEGGEVVVCDCGETEETVEEPTEEETVPETTEPSEDKKGNNGNGNGNGKGKDKDKNKKNK